MAKPLSHAEASPADSAEQRLRQLVELEFAFVWRLLRRIGVTEEDADGAAEQAFVAVAQRLSDIRAGNERAFLISTALHVAQRSRRKSEANAVVDPIAPSRVDAVEGRHARALLDAELEQLPFELRLVFVLFEIEQLGRAEIAQIVGVPLDTVSARLSRAREEFGELAKRLEASLQPQEAGDG
ncbi:MAG TPA: sigma-70 family RNA polymerase sigma factor [Polyangiaceae bacterium]|nr:sigma-70 family RNA polymerase sigma factor [Polyangiaceae bacterium]